MVVRFAHSQLSSPSGKGNLVCDMGILITLPRRVGFPGGYAADGNPG